MSKRRKTNRNGKPPLAPARKTGIPRAAVIVLAVIVMAAFGHWLWKSKQTNASTTAPHPNETSSTNAPAVLSVAMPDFQKLKGKWLRPDGGYVIEVRSVTDDGAMDAAYFNPRPIHVAKAEASLEGAVMKVFIELRDANYPGSTYTLRYDPTGDQFNGIYYQALQQQSFEVAFVRIK
jgi:hypothetical protein